MFEQLIKQMLSAALKAQAEIRRFSIGEPAVAVFVARAYRNIAARNTTNQAIFEAAVRAVQQTELFLVRLERQVTTRSILTEASANDTVRQLTVDCVYPWCKDTP